MIGMKTTDKEMGVLMAIRDSEYRDGDLLQAVWSTSITPPAGMAARGMGGVFASLSKKGLVALGDNGDGNTVSLTIAAVAHLAERRLEDEAAQAEQRNAVAYQQHMAARHPGQTTHCDGSCMY